MFGYIWSDFVNGEAIKDHTEWMESVAYNPHLLYSTLIIAILLTKGYGRNIALAVSRKLLQEPSRKLWRAIRVIKPRQIIYYGMRWGIPLHKLKDLLLLHRKLLEIIPGRQRKSLKKHSFRKRRINPTVGLYRALPLKVMSRLWGKMTTMDLPVALRQPLLGLYCRMFHVNLSEALDENLKHYCSVSEFFRRELKPGVRQVDQHSPVTSPADGTILHYGRVKEGIVEQVKGVNYSIQGFLGPSGEKESKPLLDDDFQKQLHSRPDHELFHCIIYLAPGDYHRFHSPSTWTVKHRRHFPGELLSVNPGVARWIEGLFSLNERVVYTGSWQHGFFSYTAVGATNVGSIKVYFDKDLATNTGRAYPSTVYYDKCIDDVLITKGDMIGEFNMGSTIVLIFEAPSNFKFSLYAGQKIMFGQPLGSLEISS